MKEIIITSSVLICAVLLMRLLFRSKVSRRLIYASWLLVALRLLIPVQLGHFSFSVLNQVENVTGIMDNVAKEPVSGASREDIYQDVLEDYVSSGQPVFIPEIQNKVDIALPDFSFDEIYDSLPEKGEDIILPEIKEEIEVKVQQSITVPTLGQIANTIWILGMGAMAIWFAVINTLTCRKLKKAAENVDVAGCPVPVKVSPLLSSPCLFGLLRPTVYLTYHCSKDSRIRRHVLIHELTHLKHKDHIWSLVRCVCLCVYWFNPLVWIAAFVSKRDCELACDEAVLKQLGEDERLTYGKTLVDMVATNPTPANLLETATAMHETKKALKERVNHIVKKKKHLLISALCLILVLSIVAGCSFTGKKDSTPTTDPSDPAGTTDPSDPAGTTEPSGTTAPPETSVPPTTEAPAPTPPTPEFNAGLTDWIIDEELRDYAGEVRFYSAFKATQGMQEMADEFNTYYPNIKIKLNSYQTNSGLFGSINHGIADGQVDVVHSFGIVDTYSRWADGLFLDITDKLMAEGVDMVTNWGTDAYRYNGRYYSIPCGGLQYYIAINKTAWDEAELGTIPTEWTWDEYLEACRKMTKSNEDGSIRYGGSSYSSINAILYCGTQVSGGDLYFSKDCTKSNYSDSVVLKAFERELKAELEEKIWFPLATYRNNGRKEYDTFLKGECASAVTVNVVRYVHDAKYNDTRNFITAFAPFPTEEAGQTNYMAGVHNYSHIAIAQNCQDETAAWLFTKFFSTYGSKYLVKAGHQSTWRGTTADDLIYALYGSEKEAAKYIDVESFKHVIGRTDLPAFRENTSANAVTLYSKVTGFLNDPLMKALAGELTAEECLQQASQGADAYIDSVRYAAAFNAVAEKGYEGEEGKYLAALCYQDIDKFLNYAAQFIDPNQQDAYSRSDYASYKWAIIRNATEEQRTLLKEKCLAIYHNPESTFEMRYAAALLPPIGTDETRELRYEALENYKEIGFEANMAIIVENPEMGYAPQYRPGCMLYTTYEGFSASMRRHSQEQFYFDYLTNQHCKETHAEVVAKYDEKFFEKNILLRVELEVKQGSAPPTVEKVVTGEPCYWMDRFCVYLEYEENGNDLYDLYVLYIAVPRKYYKEPIGINDYDEAFNCCINGVPFQNYG